MRTFRLVDAAAMNRRAARKRKRSNRMRRRIRGKRRRRRKGSRKGRQAGHEDNRRKLNARSLVTVILEERAIGVVRWDMIF